MTYGILATVQRRAALYGCAASTMVLIIYGHAVLTRGRVALMGLSYT